MSKPEFSRPFNLEHAKAGAPYCCRDGRPAQVLKWDRNVSDYPLLGIIGKSGDPRTWAITGSTTYGNHGEEYDCDLVMLPLGFIDGKPVFVGDEFIGHANTPCVAKVGLSSNFAGCRWPAPAPVYPETILMAADMQAFCEKHGADIRFDHSCIRGSIGPLGSVPGPVKMTVQMGRHGDPFKAIANFALRHAIDAGQVVVPGIAPSDKLLMKVAETVKNAAIVGTVGCGRHVHLIIANIDLHAIIAEITGAKDVQPIDFSIEKGDIVYKKTWCAGREPLEVVGINWALKAAAVKLSATGATVVWPVEGMFKEQFPKDAKESAQ